MLFISIPPYCILSTIGYISVDECSHRQFHQHSIEKTKDFLENLPNCFPSFLRRSEAHLESSLHRLTLSYKALSLMVSIFLFYIKPYSKELNSCKLFTLLLMAVGIFYHFHLYYSATTENKGFLSSDLVTLPASFNFLTNAVTF